MALRRTGAGFCYCTQVYAEINYSLTWPAVSVGVALSVTRNIAVSMAAAVAVGIVVVAEATKSTIILALIAVGVKIQIALTFFRRVRQWNHTGLRVVGNRLTRFEDRMQELFGGKR